MYAWICNTKRAIAGVSVTLAVVASLVTAASTASARADDTYDPYSDTVTCTMASATVTEGGSVTIPDPVPSHCTSAEGAQLTIGTAGCVVTSQYPQYKSCYAGVQNLAGGKLRANLPGGHAGKEKDSLLSYEVMEDGVNEVDGYVVLHVRHYAVPLVTRVDNHGHKSAFGHWIKLDNRKNTATVDPRPLAFNLAIKSTGHCVWSGPKKPFALAPGSDKEYLLPPAVWSVRNLKYWINSGNAGPEDKQIQIVVSPALKAAQKTC